MNLQLRAATVSTLIAVVYRSVEVVEFATATTFLSWYDPRRDLPETPINFFAAFISGTQGCWLSISAVQVETKPHLADGMVSKAIDSGQTW